jgi:hypothetical protein
VDVLLDGNWLWYWITVDGHWHGIVFFATASPEHASTKEHDREAEPDN